MFSVKVGISYLTGLPKTIPLRLHCVSIFQIKDQKFSPSRQIYKNFAGSRGTIIFQFGIMKKNCFERAINKINTTS